MIPQDDFVDQAFKLAESIAVKAQIAVHQSQSAINLSIQCDVATSRAYETWSFDLCFATEDQNDAISAFIHKTKLDGFKNKQKK